MIKESQWKIPVNGYGQAICPFYDDSDKTCLKKSARQLSNVGCEHKGDMIMCPTMTENPGVYRYVVTVAGDYEKDVIDGFLDVTGFPHEIQELK